MEINNLTSGVLAGGKNDNMLYNSKVNFHPTTSSGVFSNINKQEEELPGIIPPENDKTNNSFNMVIIIILIILVILIIIGLILYALFGKKDINNNNKYKSRQSEITML